MAEQFYTILTNTGKAKIANSLPTGTKVNLTTLKVGDSNGTYYNPSETQTDLVHTVYTCNVTSVAVDTTNGNWINITSVIPSDQGGFTIREVGVFDDGGNLIAIGKYPETYKPTASDGSTKELYLKMTLEVSNSSSVTLKIDPTVILATKSDINTLTTSMNNSISAINASLSDMVYQTAGGSATAITLAIKGTLVNGYPITFIASANNGGSATTINGKKLYKPGTTTSPNLISGKAYTVWYNSTGDCFFIKASAEGDADVSHVLATKKFSNDNDTGLVGTMPDNGQVIITPGTINKPINKGFHDGTGYVAGDSDLVSGNIKAGSNIFGVNGKSSVVDTSDAIAIAGDIISGKTAYVNGNKIIGNATITSLGGMNFASGTATSSLSSASAYFADGSTTYNVLCPVTVSGLNFTPKVVILINTSSHDISIYNALGSDGYYIGTVKLTYFNGHDQGNNATYNMQGDKLNYYVNSSGFKLPALRAGISYNWYAIG